jgi:hypothetical protein
VKTTIRVTSQHIEHGEKGCAHKCALALAFQQAGYDAMVAGHIVEIYLGLTEPIEIRLPKTAWYFIAAFDSDRPVNPFEFEIDLPPLPQKSCSHGSVSRHEVLA